MYQTDLGQDTRFQVVLRVGDLFPHSPLQTGRLETLQFAIWSRRERQQLQHLLENIMVQETGAAPLWMEDRKAAGQNAAPTDSLMTRQCNFLELKA